MARENSGLSGRRSMALGVSCLALTATAAWAQDTQPTLLEPIVIVGNATTTGTIGQPSAPFPGGQVATQANLGIFGNRDVLSTPFRLTGYTGKTIRDQQARSLADVTINEPSVRQDAPAFSERDSFFIRGFSVTNLDTLFDGLPYIANPRKSHLEGIEQVDILLGPTALAMGGTGRVGGTINLRPKRAADEPLTRLTTSYLSDSQIWTHLDVGRRYGQSGEWGVRGNLSYRNGDTALDHNSNEIGVATLGLDYRGDRFRASLDFNHTNQNINAPTSLFNALGPGDIPDAPDGNINTANPFEFHDSSYDMVAGRVEYDIQPSTTIYAAAGTSRYREDFLSSNYEYDSDAGVLTNYLSANPQEIEGASVEAGIRSAFRTGTVGHEMSFSVSRSENKNNRGEFNPRTLGLPSYPIDIFNPIYLPTAPDLSGVPRAKDTIPFADILTTSVAIADTMSFMGDRMEVTIGGRHQKIRSRGFNTRPGIPSAPVGAQNYDYEESVFTPAVAASVRVTDDLSVYANYVEALNEGEVAPVGTDNAGQLTQPYVSKQKEIGLKYNIETAVLSASLFEIRQENGFTKDDVFGINGLQVNRGLELSIFGEPMQGLRLLGGMTLMDAELRDTEDGAFDGKDVRGVPDTAISVYGEYDTPWIEDFTLTGRVLYGGSTYYDEANTQEVSDWTRLDIGARYALQLANGQPLEIRANVFNVLDENYWASSARGFLAAGAPRTFALSASIEF